MKILVAPDSFKGSLEALEICNIAQKAARKIVPDAEIVKLPMADGGEGTVISVINALDGKLVSSEVLSPDFRKISAQYGIFNENCAIMEMAQASGITKVCNREILKMNTFGTGQMVLDAIDKGVSTIYLGIGGSATNDLGMGFASAIGVKFLDKNGNFVQPIPQNFEQICDFDDSEIFEKVRKTKFVIMSDVKNPLYGKNGATYVFGRQKGANDSNIDDLERGIKHVSCILEKKLGRDIANVPGAGAAGGLGAALLSFTDCKMQSGIQAVLEICDFKNHLKDCDFVITGEGMMDYQSAFGKVAFGVGQMCKEQGVPCFAVVGGLGENYQAMYDCGISSIITTVDGIMSLENAIKNAEKLCENAFERVFRFIKCV